MSITWKLMLFTLLIVYVPVHLLNRSAIRFFDHHASHTLENQMTFNAKMLTTLWLQTHDTDNTTPTAGSFNYANYLKENTDLFATHFAILSPRGEVWTESTTTATRLHVKNYAAQEAVQKAMAGEYGAGWNMSEDRSYNYFHIAIPVTNQTGNVQAIGWARRDTNRIIRFIKRVRDDQQRTTWISVGLAGLLAAILAFTLTRPLRRLTRAAEFYSDGNLKWELEATGRDEIATLTRTVGNMAEEIEDRNNFNRDFMQAVSHELRTPLTVIQSSAEILAGEVSPPARAKFSEAIQRQAKRMLHLVMQLKELTRFDRESVRGHQETVEYTSFIARVVEELDLEQVECHLPDEQIYVRLYPEHIEQVVANLLDNARRYANGQPIGVFLKVQDGEVTTTVRDHGPGIPEDMQENIFKQFFTTVPRGESTEYGTGLGLTIAQSILLQHDSQLQVDSAEGQGAAFRFTLPCSVV